MMHFIVRIILYFAVSALIGCVNHQALSPRSNDQAACKASCAQWLQVCSQVCHNDCKDCNQSAHLNSVKNYRKYKCEQEIQGGFVARELNSFSDPLQCRKITCDCLADYTVCVQSCKGLIHKRLQVAPICC